MQVYTSVNNVAVTTFKLVYPRLVDNGCMAHTTDHVGEHMMIPV